MLADMESLVVHVQEKKVSLIRRASVSCEGKAARKVPAAYSNLSLSNSLELYGFLPTADCKSRK